MNIKKIETNKFKTTQVALFLTIPLKREEATKVAMIQSLLKRGSKNYPDMFEINRMLDSMYNATLRYNITHAGDNCVLKYEITTINDKYALENEDITNSAINMLFDIVFNPYIEDGGFKEEYVKQEKKNLIQAIESKIDDKQAYSRIRCTEEMFKGESYSTYALGYVDEVEDLNGKNLYEKYKEIIENARIDLVLCGENLDKIKIPEINAGKEDYKAIKEEHKILSEEKVVREALDINQGKLTIGLNITGKDTYKNALYNTILGGGANSKLFQNVREKASLAYHVSSQYVKSKDVIFIRAGIEFDNFDKTVSIIKKQLEDIKNGNVSDDEFNSAKELMLASLKMLKEDQDGMIESYFSNNLFEHETDIDKIYENVSKLTKEDAINAGKNVSIDTIFFLEGGKNK